MLRHFPTLGICKDTIDVLFGVADGLPDNSREIEPQKLNLDARRAMPMAAIVLPGPSGLKKTSVPHWVPVLRLGSVAKRPAGSSAECPTARGKGGHATGRSSTVRALVAGPECRRSRQALARVEQPPSLLLVEDDAQQGFVDLDAPVVLDEAELPELVHEVVHARARGPHHVGKDLLRNFRSSLISVP